MKHITMSDLERMIEAYNSGKEVKRGCFYAHDCITDNYTALDNRTGEMYLEVFTTKEAVKEWLAE